MSYQGKVAVITGGGGGIGHGYALACLKEGMKVVLGDISQERLDHNAEKLRGEVEGAEVSVFKLDASSKEETQALADFTMKKYGRVDMVFNNAGVHFHKAFFLTTDEDWEFIMRCNLWSVIHGMRVFLPLLEKNKDGGNIINTASSGGINFGQTMAHYCATKAGVLHLSGAVASELKYYGSKVNVICVMPDFTTSNLMDSCADVRKIMNLENAAEEQTQLDIGQESNFYNMVTAPYKGEIPLPQPIVIPLGEGQEMHIFSMPNEEAGELVMQAIKDGKQFVLTHGGKMSNPNMMAAQINQGYVLTGSM